MFGLEIQYRNVWGVLHQITVEVVSVGEVLLAELSEPCGYFVLILDDAHLAVVSEVHHKENIYATELT